MNELKNVTFNVQFMPRVLWMCFVQYVFANDESAKALWNLVWKSKWIWGEPKNDK